MKRTKNPSERGKKTRGEIKRIKRRKSTGEIIKYTKRK